MPTPPVSDAVIKERIDVLGRCGGNQTIAAGLLGITRYAIQEAIRQAEKRNLVQAPTMQPELAPQILLPKQDNSDPIRLRAAADENARLRAALKEAERRAADAENYRSSILGLELHPAEPIAKPKPSAAKHNGKQALVLHLSDLHFGEVVDRDEVMGVNEYSLEIAQRRTARLFHTTSQLATTSWPRSDGAPSKVYILLGGDLISGHGLHPEHAETDAGTAYEQCKWAAESISSGILRLHVDLKAHFGKAVPFDIISVVGNHGRMTFGKPRTKLVSIQSYDTLVSDFVEASLKAQPTIKHYRPKGFDAYFDVVGWPCLLTHGDRMGSGGGTGFIGPMATIVKGHRKIIDTEHRQRRPVFKVFSGHFHTTGVSPFGFANGSGVGYGEFAKSLRADPEPAQQNLVVFHERFGVLRWHPIGVGVPEEGSIYAPTAGLIMPEMVQS